jgi:hypothetical protein
MIKNKKWEVRLVKLNELIPNPDNPRTITAENFGRLKKKIERQGFRGVICVDNNNIILGGNQRYAALMDMGYAEELVPVTAPLFKMTEKERQEIIITDNLPDGDWNMEILANQYDTSDLIEWGMDVPWTEEPLDPENPEAKEEDFDINTKKVKIIFKYQDSHETIDKFIREMKQKYPELLYEVEIDD